MGVKNWAATMGVVVLLSLTGGPLGVESHGRLMAPAGRSTAWRMGFDTPVNWNDDELNCGGIGNQWDLNNGNCGVCGDPYQNRRPRDNEAGGLYGTGTITAEYKQGQEVTVEVDLTTSHLGYFEFRLCVNNDPPQYIEQSCLDQHLLELADGSGTRFPIHHEYEWEYFSIPVRLPEGLVCSQCVLQWDYTCGNNWGTCADGTEGMGCGPQETFRGCSDISIA